MRYSLKTGLMEPMLVKVWSSGTARTCALAVSSAGSNFLLVRAGDEAKLTGYIRPPVSNFTLSLYSLGMLSDLPFYDYDSCQGSKSLHYVLPSPPLQTSMEIMRLMVQVKLRYSIQFTFAECAYYRR